MTRDHTPAAQDTDDEGASPWQQLLYAAKTDSVELATSCLADPKLGDDVNKVDGLGCTALHYAARLSEVAGTSYPRLDDTPQCSHYYDIISQRNSVKGPSPDVIELLLEFDGTDVDPQDKLNGDTPLHYAVKLEHPEARSWMVKTLLEAGADGQIANKYREKPVDLLPPGSELRRDFGQAQAESAMDAGDIVADDDVGGESGGDSGEE